MVVRQTVQPAVSGSNPASLQPAGTCHSLLGSQQGWHDNCRLASEGRQRQKKYKNTKKIIRKKSITGGPTRHGCLSQIRPCYYMDAKVTEATRATKFWESGEVMEVDTLTIFTGDSKCSRVQQSSHFPLCLSTHSLNGQDLHLDRQPS